MPYDAFMSYSHAADQKLAPALQSALHQFARPWYKLRAVRVFRDRTTLALTPELWPAIVRALNESEYLILMASTAAAESKWIERELGHWLTISTAQKILIVLTDGELRWDDAARDFDWKQTTVLPQLLSRHFSAEPLFLDLRWARTEDQLSIRNSKFQDAVAELAAVLHDRPKDEIAGEDVRLHRRTRILTRIAVASLLTLTLAATIAAWQAIRQRQVAQRMLDEALRNQSLYLAQEAERMVPLDPGMSILLSLEALPSPARTRPYVTQAEVALQRSVSKAQGDLLLVDKLGKHTDGAFSPDGRLAATASDRGEIQVWSTETAHETAAFKIGDGPISKMAFTPSGDHMVALFRAGDLAIWSLREKSQVRIGDIEIHAVEDVAVSPTEDLVAVGFKNGRICLLRVLQRPVSRSLQSPNQQKVSAIAFSDDGLRMISVSGSEAATWDTKSGRMLARLAGHRGPIWSAELDRHGRLAATASSDATARIWDADHGKSIMALPSREQIVAARFTVDSKRVMTAGLNGTIQLFDLKEQRLLRKIVSPPGFDVTVTQAAFSSRGKYAVITSMHLARDFSQLRNVVELLDPLTLEVMYAFDCRNDLALHAISDRNARQFLIISDSSVGHLWQPQGGDLTALLEGHQSAIRDGAFDSATSVMVTVSNDSTARSWNASNGQALTVFRGHRSHIWRVALSPTGHRMATASGDGTAGLWDLSNGRRTAELHHDGPVWSVTFDPSGLTIVTGSDDRTARLWDVESGRLVATMVGHNGPVRNVLFTRDGHFILTASWDRTLRVWDSYSHALKATLSGHGRELTAVDVSPDSTRAATASYDGTVGLWDLRNLRKTATLKGHRAEIWSVTFSPNGKLLATASLDGSARLWDAVTGAQLGVLSGHRGPVTSVDFSHDGQQIVTASGDNTARIWDVTTFEQVGILEGHADGLTRAVFDRSNKHILTTSLDGTARLWSVRTPKTDLIDFAQRLLGERRLTAVERARYFLSTPSSER